MRAWSNVVSRKDFEDPKDYPTEARDYLKPEFKGKLVISYPNDADAQLFWWYKVVQKYGWFYIETLMKQVLNVFHVFTYNISQ